MRLDQLSGVIAFLRVAETGSFTRAAAELGVTPPSLSEAIKGLEARLGVRLLNRTTRSVGLTEEGAAYLERVAPAVDEIQAAARDAQDTGGRIAGTLRLTLPWIAAPLLIEPIMAGFVERYPDVRLDLVFDDGFSDLASGGFDAGIRIGELVEKDMIAMRLGGALKTAVLASPTYLERHGRPAAPADLARHRCIAYRFASTRRIAPWEFAFGEAEVAIAPNAAMTFNSMAMVVSAATKGLGITYTTRKLAAKQLASGTLISVLDDYCPSYEPFHIYYSSRRLVPPKLAAFVEFAREMMRPVPG